MRKAQVQVISLILVTGIIMTLSGVAYFWGRPLIEKRGVETDIATAKSFIIKLDNYITDVARNGGTKSISIPRMSGSSVTVDDDGNSVIFQFIAAQGMLSGGENSAAVPIDSSSMDDVGRYGEDPRVITMTGDIGEGGYLMKMRSKYRELLIDEPDTKGYMIEISPSGRTTGTNKVEVTLGGRGVRSGQASNGGDLSVTTVIVSIY